MSAAEMTDEIPFYEREIIQRKRVESAGEAISAVRVLVEEKRREKIADLVNVRLHLADAYLGKGDISLAVAAHASAIAEIAALADAALALHVREQQARLAQLDAEVAAHQREIESAEKRARPHEAEIETLRSDLSKVSKKLGNQRVADEETPMLQKTQTEVKSSLAALVEKYESPIKSGRDSLAKVEQLRPSLEQKIATAIVAASVVDDDRDEQEAAGGRSWRR
jgi:septal ring factor EnvC (AmiA/AmiB activator)